MKQRESSALLRWIRGDEWVGNHAFGDSGTGYILTSFSVKTTSILITGWAGKVNAKINVRCFEEEM